MSEDERTLWCGNLSEKVTEELLYELCLLAGPIENVTIPRDSDRRQRSYAFVTYLHACSVEYAMKIFEGTTLFKRPLTLHRKNRNGPNPAASPKENFKYPSTNGRFNNEPTGHMQDAQDNNVGTFNGTVGRTQDPTGYNPFMSDGLSSHGNDVTNNATARNDIRSALALAIGSGGCTSEMLMLLGQQMLGAELPAYEDNNQQNSTYRTKMNHPGRHHRNPYSRSDRFDRHQDRSNTRQRSYRNEHDDRCEERERERDRDRDRDHRRRR
uniref:Uncharacterized protein n=1 Tax=Anopheles atroparvus TaxID=41427 RepID=A0A182IQ61_ANOAO